MASRHPRVQVPVDPEVAAAIASGRRLIGGTHAPDSQVLRTLALRGIEAMEADERARAESAEFLVSVAEGRSGLDLHKLRTARDRAWS